MTYSRGSLCFSCARFTAWDLEHPSAYCAAFPDGIPDDIVYDGFDHRLALAHEGDHGIRWVLDAEHTADLTAYERVLADVAASRVIGDAISPDMGPDFDADPDAEAIAFCLEMGYVDDGDGNWIDPTDPVWSAETPTES